MLKRTIAEWITVAKISKETGHLFLEGASDASIIAHASGYPANIDFRTASEIDDDAEGSTALCGGNKLRLTKLAQAATTYGNIENLRCLVDSDFECFVENFDRSEAVFFTGCSNLPSLSLNFDCLRGFMMKGFGFLLDQDCWKFICKTLRFAFVARYIAACAERPNSAPNLADFVSSRKRLEFDRASYISRYFPGKKLEEAQKIEQIEEICEWITMDISRNCNSNDLFELLYRLLRDQSKISGSTPKGAIRQAYFSAIDDNLIRQGNLRTVGDWIASLASRARESSSIL